MISSSRPVDGSSLLDNLRETFANLNKYQIKLNPLKCTFGVPAGQLLGYLISARGIEANLEKIEAIVKMEKPRNLKGIQRLTGPTRNICISSGSENSNMNPKSQIRGNNKKIERNLSNW